MKTFEPKLAWATDANFPASASPWSVTPTKVAPSSAIQAAGIAPAAQLSAQEFNYLKNNELSALAVLAHDALTRWTNLDAGGLSTFVQHLVAIRAPSGFGAVGAGHDAVLATCFDNISAAQIEISHGGNDFSGLILTGSAVGFKCVATDANGAIFGALSDSSAFRYSTNYGASWASATAGIGGGVARDCMKTASLYLAGGDDGHMYHSATLAGTWTNTAVDGAHLFAVCVAIAQGNGRVVSLWIDGGVTRAYYSTDDGLTWTPSSAGAMGAGGCTLCFSAGRNAFVVINSLGEFWESSDGQAWGKNTTAINLLPVTGGRTLASVGKCIAVLTNRGPTNTFYARGVAYTFDGGKNWNEFYFGDNTGNTVDLKELIAVNGRLYACNQFQVFRSGALEAPDALYVGT